MKAIFIDIDIKYEYMEKYGLLEILDDKINYCLQKFKLKPLWIKKSKSQCGNLHLHIIVNEDIDPETIIRLKYCIGEDHKRLSHTIRRYERTGKILDFFWLTENKKCKD